MAAIIDVYSRKILGWSISNTMTAKWCTELMEDTIKTHGKPEIFNTDQSVQYTSEEHISALKKYEIKISMDGKGRATDNAFIERFWRSIKQEKIYLNPPNGGVDLFQKVKEHVYFYNTERRHTSIKNNTPEKYFNPINTNTKNKPIFELSMS